MNLHDTAPAATASADYGSKEHYLLQRAVRSNGLIIVIAIVFLIGFLQFLAVVVVRDPLFLPAPSEVLSTAIKLANSGKLGTDITVSLEEAGIGFGIASIVGVSLGAIMARFRLFGRFVRPCISAANATPIIALGPLFILWFGLGLLAKVAVVFSICIFPIIINTNKGLTSAPDNLVEVTRSFGANNWQIFKKILFPSALPMIVAGERLAAALSLIGVVVAEFFGSSAGLGYLIFNASQTFATASLFVGIAILAGVGIVVVECLALMERRLAPWREEDAE